MTMIVAIRIEAHAHAQTKRSTTQTKHPGTEYEIEQKNIFCEAKNVSTRLKICNFQSIPYGSRGWCAYACVLCVYDGYALPLVLLANNDMILCHALV